MGVICSSVNELKMEPASEKQVAGISDTTSRDKFRFRCKHRTQKLLDTVDYMSLPVLTRLQDGFQLANNEP
jgi:hypothetical protein